MSKNWSSLQEWNSQKRFAPSEVVRTHSTSWISAAAHVRTVQNTQETRVTPTHPVYDRFSATPAGQISLFSNRLSFSTRANAYGTLSPLLISLKLQSY